MRVRRRILGKSELPRLSVFRSNKYIYAQIIDDEKGITLLEVSSQKIKGVKNLPTQAGKSTGEKITKVREAFEVGKEIAKKALEKKIESVVFDRNGYKYHGRVKSLADGAREGGLKL